MATIGELVGWNGKKFTKTDNKPKEEKERKKNPSFVYPPIAGKQEQAIATNSNSHSGSPRIQRRTLFGEEAKVVAKKLDVYIGLDFGTSFTKSAFTLSGNDQKIYSVAFDNNSINEKYYLPSVVYYSNIEQKLFTEKKSSDLQVIKYFKMSMIDDLRQEATVNADTKTSFDKLCSVFYLANVISYIKKYIKDFSKKINNREFDFDWHINMGVPFDDGNKDSSQKKLFDKVLNIAYLLSEKEKISEMSLQEILQEIDDFCAKTQSQGDDVEEGDTTLHTYPELYAEVLLYQLDRQVPSGCYTLIDIGGGTVDIATFYKEITKSEQNCHCVTQKVIALGVESLIEKIKTKTANFESVRNELLQNQFILAAEEFEKVYSNSVLCAHQNLPPAFSGKFNNFPYFILGGGKSIPFYEERILKCQWRLSSVNIESQKRIFIDEYLKDMNFEIKNDRLIISQMLAQPSDRIPGINGFPNWFAAAVAEKKASTAAALAAKKEEAKWDPLGEANK